MKTIITAKRTSVRVPEPDLSLCPACRFSGCPQCGTENVAHPARLDKHGVLSVRPDVASDKAKAVQRERYAELRWSLATSPSHSMGRGH